MFHTRTQWSQSDLKPKELNTWGKNPMTQKNQVGKDFNQSQYKFCEKCVSDKQLSMCFIP